MTSDEVAQYLHVHRTTIYKLAKRNKIPAFKIGTDWRFNREAIDEWSKDQASTFQIEMIRVRARPRKRV